MAILFVTPKEFYLEKKERIEPGTAVYMEGPNEEMRYIGNSGHYNNVNHIQYVTRNKKEYPYPGDRTYVQLKDIDLKIK